MRSRFRRWAGCSALATGLVTAAGLVLAVAPAQASTASVSAAQAQTSRPASSSADDSPALVAKDATENYTNASCNTTNLKANEASCDAVVYTPARSSISANVSPDDPPSTALGPSDIQSAYNLPSATAGDGVTVAIVDAYGDSEAESDLAAFRSYYNLPPCTTANGCFTKVAQDGSTNYPADDDGWALETSLDLDAVSSACPNCHILLVEADDATIPNLGAAVDEAVALGAKYVSNSYGVSGEESDETQFDSYYNHPGVVVDAAAGDEGDITNWPATDPDVTSVGGTTLIRDSSVPRGWDESAWGDGVTGDEGGGSGCSLYEPQPSYQASISQLTAVCPDNRAISDVSADADPNSGLATYDTLGEGGWLQVGGTSLATPLITAVYALAGTPAPGTFPVTYPYSDPTASSDLYDITTGSNGSCGTVLCNAGTGWDGPTGLGSPDGVAAFTTGPHGTIAGQVTDSATGAVLAGATVTAPGGFTATTDASGDYTMSLPTGTYDLTVSDFGYADATEPGVTVSQDQTTTENVTLTALPSVKVSGTVTDGSGQGWPLYSKITVAGDPAGAIYTNPYTGQYSVQLPQNATYQLTITPQYPGYQTKTASVTVGTTNVVANEQATVNATTCNAPGYGFTYSGYSEDFTGWTGTTPQDGWSNIDNEGNGEVWKFGSNPTGEGAPPNTDGQFAIIDSNAYGLNNTQDTSLVTPVINLSDQPSPSITFDTEYYPFPGENGNVDLSLDGGQTWTTVDALGGNLIDSQVTIPIPQAAGQSDVEVRFHFTATWGWWWSLDNVFIGGQACSPQNAGIVAGSVTDNNTGDLLDDVKVASVANPAQFGVTAASADPAFPHGFYWLLANPAGSTQFTATDGAYTPSTATVDVAPGSVTQQDFVLKAGHITLSASSVSVSERLNAAKSKTVKFTNNGTTPVTVQLGEEPGSFTPQGETQAQASGAPLEKIAGTFSTAAAVTASKPAAKKAAPSETPSGAPWTNIANYPTPVMDNATAYDPSSGDVYSIGGYNGTANSATSYVYDPSAQAWSQIAPLPQALESPAAAFLNGQVYVVGGWDAAGTPVNEVYDYDPASNSWSQAASLPVAIAATTTAVLGGDLYVIGGCTTSTCAPTSDEVFRYDPSANSWTQLASYPMVVAFAGCAGIDNEIVCAGGVDADTDSSYTATEIYDPSSDTWSAGAAMPYDDWGMAYAGANNQLQVAGGVTANGNDVTNEASAYNPSSNSWSALPNANDAEYRGGSTCGIYKIGGSTGQFTPTDLAEQLPGYTDCGPSDVPWLSEDQTQFTVAAGSSVTLTLTMDSSVLAQPGTYTAKLAVQTDSPYAVSPISITLTVTPPASWGKISGTVTDTSGNPLAGATVQICTMYVKATGLCGPVTYTLETDSSGYYQLWLKQGYNPLQAIAAKNGYQPVSKTITIVKGGNVTTNFTLAPDS